MSSYRQCKTLIFYTFSSCKGKRNFFEIIILSCRIFIFSCFFPVFRPQKRLKPSKIIFFPSWLLNVHFSKNNLFHARFRPFLFAPVDHDDALSASSCCQQSLELSLRRCRTMQDNDGSDRTDASFCKEIVPKFNTWKVHFLERKTVSESKKNLHLWRFGRNGLTKWAVLHFKTARFARQNEPFRPTEWAVLASKMARSARL